jgi:hypothetical protein
MPKDAKTYVANMNESQENLGVQQHSGCMKSIRIGTYLLASLFLTQCASVNAPINDKIKGIALESPAKPNHPQVMTEISSIGSNYVCLMPYSFMKDLHSDHISFEYEWQWWGEKSAGIKVMIDEAQSAGMSVMLKPHLWIADGTFTGLLSFSEDSTRISWEKSYTDYILLYAQIAEEKQLDLLCIGTELCGMVRSDKDYWARLVSEVKKVYKGKLTYAANWDTYDEFPWEIGMDYVGVDAYFPVADNDSPDMEMVGRAWIPLKEELKQFSASQKLPILFTEFGYRSVDCGLRKPWEQGREGNVCIENQTLGYEGFFQEVWSEDWLAGVFIWKWHTKEHLARKDSTRYSPQGKPALDVLIKEWNGEH